MALFTNPHEISFQVPISVVILDFHHFSGDKKVILYCEVTTVFRSASYIFKIHIAQTSNKRG